MITPMNADHAPVPTRSARKRAAIVEAAREVFLAGGFASTSMEDVARRAEVSKQTVYQHFSDKERLFTEVMVSMIEPMHAALHTAVGASVAEADSDAEIASTLRAFGRALLQQVLRPDVVRLRRLVASEADRFPDVARLWHQEGPDRTIHELAEQLVRSGAVAPDAAPLAAQRFMWALIGDPLVRGLFVPTPPLSEEEIQLRLDTAVADFIAANRG